MPFLNTDRRNALQHLTLKVDVVQREPLMDPGQWDQWAVIDTMLSMKPQFVLLKTVVIMVTVFSRVSANFSTMKNVEESLSEWRNVVLSCMKGQYYLDVCWN
ncbi:hypothetical protein BT96DRAFT_450004 [Gymnopus androsaceus JB14]|uniref:Uncharacterized protein n=1 Tax=Gymnopus androsaceus JB14 TaxID=1447944 RepID=A0A6A4GS88_9AGAR|nr:hypothetical protein BT96DRAFT_450004 [Gymnopus androsaceus JB14]